jgi:hypothetical protein
MPMHKGIMCRNERCIRMRIHEWGTLQARGKWYVHSNAETLPLTSTNDATFLPALLPYACLPFILCCPSSRERCVSKKKVGK